MNIRKATIDDFEAYFALEEKFIKEQNKHTEKYVHVISLNKNKIKLNFNNKIKQRNKLFLVGIHNKKVIAYFFGEIFQIPTSKYGYNRNKSRAGYLENVFIQKRYRGKGLFKLFLDEFESFLKEKNVSIIQLHVDYPNYAKNVYLKNGFQKEVFRMFKPL